MSPSPVDHLIVGVADLERGVQEVEALLGIRPTPGGSHPAWGTRNAILSLGERCYLEVLAPDPGLETPDWGCLFGVEKLHEPRLVGWAMATDRLEGLAGAAMGAGLPMGAIGTGGRTRPDGSRVAWTLTDPRAVPPGGVIPFLIDWGESAHPAEDAPSGGELVGLSAGHPEAMRLESAFREVGFEMTVVPDVTPSLTAHIRTPAGVAILR